MFDIIYFELRNWWLDKCSDQLEEFEQLESKHTRVHHDDDLYENIRIH